MSSLGAVIFHTLRTELIFGDGVPLGLLASGWSFAQARYLLSPFFYKPVLTSELLLVHRVLERCAVYDPRLFPL